MTNNQNTPRTDQKLWITGPSGAGKSYLIDLIRRRVAELRPITFDFDFIGYRKPGEDWSKWHINQDMFKLLAANAKASNVSVVAVGCDSDPEGMRRAALKAGFEPVVILPSVTELAARRRQRGDKPEKVAEAAESLTSWKAHADAWNAPVVHSAQAVLSQWRI